MAGRRCDVLDVREMLRRLRLGESARAVAKGLGVSRNTVREYVAWFEAEKFLPGDTEALPAAAELHERLARAEPVQQPPRLMAYRDEIGELVGAGLQVKVAWERFSAAHPDVRASYTAFRRFVRRYVDERPRRAVVRLEVGPGDEAQVDFGYAGLIPRAAGEVPAKTWVFVMTLSHSRHQYVELVHDQTVGTWLSLHRNAFQFFGGVPRKVVLDNLKAGIVKASVTDPEVQRAYRECAEHYGFVISPCVARTPEHKGKVERGVQYVKGSFLAGRSFRGLGDANNEAIDWVVDHAGVRVHGTTQEVPLHVFEARERPALLPLPSSPFELVEWKQAKLHPDCHVVFARSYYSVHRGTAVVARHLPRRPDLPRAQARGDARPRAAAGAARHEPCAPAAEEAPLPHADADLVPRARGPDRARHRPVHRAAPRRRGAGSPPRRPGHPAAGRVGG
jgi:transposase